MGAVHYSMLDLGLCLKLFLNKFGVLVVEFSKTEIPSKEGLVSLNVLKQETRDPSCGSHALLLLSNVLE